MPGTQKPAFASEHVFVVEVDRFGQRDLPRLCASIGAQDRTDWCALVVVQPSASISFSDSIACRSGRVIVVPSEPGTSGTAALSGALDAHVAEPDALVIPLRLDDELLGPNALSLIRTGSVGPWPVIGASVTIAGELACRPVAVRRYALRAAASEDGTSGLLAGLEPDVFVSLTRPLLQRERPVLVLPPGALPSVSTLVRPRPVGSLIRELGERWVVFLRHAAKEPAEPLLSLEANRKRGLSASGHDEARALARVLPLAPELVLVSPVLRTQETGCAFAHHARPAPRIVTEDTLLGGVFRDHERWSTLKREQGWENLVRAWIAEIVPPCVVTPAREAVSLLARRTVALARSHGAERTLVVTQGYINTAIFHALTGRLDFSNGPLYGFQTSLEQLERVSNWI